MRARRLVMAAEAVELQRELYRRDPTQYQLSLGYYLRSYGASLHEARLPRCGVQQLIS